MLAALHGSKLVMQGMGELAEPSQLVNSAGVRESKGLACAC